MVDLSRVRVSFKTIPAEKIPDLSAMGFLRFWLALTVPTFHIMFAYFPDAGRHAVGAFFCISGFLVTMISRKRYADRPGAYLLNRALRIYPLFWACLPFAFAALVLFPEASGRTVVGSGSHVPANFAEWITVFTLIPLADIRNPIVQAWSLAIEIQFYMLIGLVTARSFALTAVAFIVSVYLAVQYIATWYFYAEVVGAAFLFFTGSMAWLLRPYISFPRWLVITALIVVAIAMYGLPLMYGDDSRPSVRLNLLLFLTAACMFVILAGIERLAISSPTIRRLSEACGDLAYPLFLSNLAVGVPFYHFGFRGLPLLLLTVICSLALSLLLLQIVEQPINRLRDIIRRSKKHEPDAPARRVFFNVPAE